LQKHGSESLEKIKMKNKRITITGGKGFLGKHLIRKFQERDFRNIAIADVEAEVKKLLK